MSCDFISVWLSMSALNERETPRRDIARCLFTFFPLSLPLSSPEVSGVQSSCHQGKGVKISVWFRFPERRIRLEENQNVVRFSTLHWECKSPSRFTPLCGAYDRPNTTINSVIYNSNPTFNKNNSLRTHSHKITDCNSKHIHPPVCSTAGWQSS